MSVEIRDLEKRIQYDANGGCWLWSGCQGRGYGRVGVDGAIRLVHRVMWTLQRGPIPDGLHVLHKCDVRACCNPDHLFLGTHKDNMQDMVKKGRHGLSNRPWRSSWCGSRIPRARGPQSGRAKLSYADVAEMKRLRNEGETLASLARKFGVGLTAVRHATLGLTYSDAPTILEEKPE